MPTLDKFYQEESDRAQVFVVIQSKDTDMLDVMAEGGHLVPVLIDRAGITRELGVHYTPTTVVLDRDGAPVKTLSGPADPLRLSRILDDLTG